MRFALWLSFGVLATVGACDRGGDSSVSPPVQPAPVDIDGSWMITKVERMDGSGEPLPEPSLGASEFLPVAIGNRFEFVDGGAVDAQGDPLYGGVAPAVYVNEIGAYWWRFEVRHEASDPPYVLDVRAFFEAVDEDTLEGAVQVGEFGGGVPVNTILPDPNGTFRIRIERLTSQTDR